MEAPITIEQIEYTENFLASDDVDTAMPMLLDLVDEVEDFARERCQATDEVQYFSFEDDFELLAYKQVEQDPRRLVLVDAPFDRLYSDLAYAYLKQQELELAKNALMQAVRWNPMNCTYRLDLAEIYRALEDEQQWAALSLSVVERASDARSLGCAYANLGRYFLEAAAVEGVDDESKDVGVKAASACLRLALEYAPTEQRVQRLQSDMENEHADAADLSEDVVMEALSQQGVPAGPNAEVVICLLTCATDCVKEGDVNEATRLTVRARDLVGQETCAQLVKLIRQNDAELAHGGGKGQDAGEGAGARDSKGE